MRSLVPAETLVYLETNDLAAALQPIVDSKPFTEVATSKPDLSALKGVQIAVAITGFETSLERVNDVGSIGRVRPRFVTVVDTHTSNSRAVAFARNGLDDFLDNALGPVEVVEEDKGGGRYFEYTPIIREGSVRKGYAFVIGSFIYFGNDASVIEKALAVRRDEADSLAKAGKLQPSVAGALASGYVSTDGVANIASIISVKFASESTDVAENARPALAEMLAGLIRGTVAEVRWHSLRSSEGIEDRFVASLPSPEPRDPDELWTGLVDSLFEEIEDTSASEVIDVLGERGPYGDSANTIHRREDHFTATTAERRITTDLGFLGWLIAQLDQD